MKDRYCKLCGKKLTFHIGELLDDFDSYTRSQRREYSATCLGFRKILGIFDNGHTKIRWKAPDGDPDCILWYYKT
jgi:hypothetical protein